MNPYTGQEEGGGGWGTNILETYRALSALTPLLTSLIGGSGTKKQKGPSTMQKLMVRAMMHPGQPLQATVGELLDPNILGIPQPQQFGGSALPMGLAAASIAPTALKGIGSLADILMPRGQQQATQGPPPPIVDASSVPQVDLGGGISMDYAPQETPVDMSPADAQALYESSIAGAFYPYLNWS